VTGPIAIGVFVFVALVVAGWRALNLLDSVKAEEQASRRKGVVARAGRVDYTGAIYNAHGREIEG
jgi:hypothetical protein